MPTSVPPALVAGSLEWHVPLVLLAVPPSPIATFPASDSDSGPEEDTRRPQVRIVRMEAEKVVWPPMHGVTRVCTCG